MRKDYREILDREVEKRYADEEIEGLKKKLQLQRGSNKTKVRIERQFTTLRK